MYGKLELKCYKLHGFSLNHDALHIVIIFNTVRNKYIFIEIIEIYDCSLLVHTFSKFMSETSKNLFWLGDL